MRSDERGLTPVQALAAQADRARRGEPIALATLRATLESDPELWPHLGNLAGRSRRAWIALAAGSDPAVAEALGRHLDGLGAELAGPSPSPIERLLAENAATCWLQTACCDAAAAAPGAGVKLAKFLLQRQDRAHRRYLAALRALSDLRRLVTGPGRGQVALRPSSGPGPGERDGGPGPTLSLVVAEGGEMDAGERDQPRGVRLD